MNIRDEVARVCPSLRVYTQTAALARISGPFPLLDEDQRSMDEPYQLSITVNGEFPRVLPRVKEIGERIPRDVAHHVSPSTGELCVVLEDELWFNFPKGISFGDYLAGPLRSYLIGTSLVAAGQPWPFGEFAHGGDGMYEFYRERFGTADHRVLREFLLMLGAEKIPPGTWPCPCGKKRIADCAHFSTVIDLRERMPRFVFERALSAVRRDS